ncbi:ABC transporter substrate-binding protein [Halogeometricum sp. S1BR25-6]|uniref:ABC transporter substrate-binding protein n=1 Tax=Halogeometricum salsisoli TaxID=2950536 RepID=A0ABU2GJ66_9EURY|nr:ABC transporter substrate-binding protein [Halogeometricum sp. S1BR25-6]MDS0300830.1 ABC transporter substrate-binding protein [Halogeometricum sp. S1BR25-6]
MPQSSPSTVRRRAVLGTLATGVTALSGGCVRRLRTVAGWRSANQVSLEIKTVPADADPYALRIARQVAAWFRAAGIDAQVTPMASEELLRQVLVQNDFELFVARLPDQFHEPDGLYSLLHSRFADAPGWQNPFGYANLDVDDLLETQRTTTGEERREAVYELQRSIARTQPFTLLSFPDDIRAARTDNYGNWRTADLDSPLGYLSLTRSGGDGDNAALASGTSTSNGADGTAGAVPNRGSNASSPTATPTRTPTPTPTPTPTDVATTTDEARTLRTATTDKRATENLNPLSVEYRRDGLITGLLYDSLGVETGDGVEAWLAESWAFSGGGNAPSASVRLRPDLTWHDGESLTAEDVAFTHRLLADTAMETGTTTEDESDARIPAPRFQGRNSLVADVRATGTRTVEFDFVECEPQLATRAFTVPVLPEHVWTERTSRASVSGIEIGPATEAIVTNNIPPVGSGPLEFAQNTPRESLVLERFDEHFLFEASAEAGVPARPPEFERLSVQVVGSDATAVEMVADADADVTGTTVGASTVPRIGRAPDLELLVGRSETPFILGHNAGRSPTTNPRFRNTLARLVDQSFLVNDVFGGYARPAVSPLAGTKWLPDDLRWGDENPVTPFIGSDGELNVDRAREAFRDAGYQYSDGRLLEGN